MTDRSSLQREVSDRLGDRQLIWFGTRGDDVESVVDLPQFAGAISMVGTYRRRSLPTAVSLEDFSGTRVDLDQFDIDAHAYDDAVRELRTVLLRTLGRPSAVFTYRPSMFLSAAALVGSDWTRYLGPFVNQQAAFEFKPWVEDEIAKLGVPSVPWRHIGDHDQMSTFDALQVGPVVLRRSQTTGGVGLVKVDSPEQLMSGWPVQSEGFVSVAPYLADAVPINVGAVVWPDVVTVHHTSIQLVGLPSCTSRPFGYCGNDFGAARELELEVLDQLDRSVTAIGVWLREQAYLGAFGVDFLLHGGRPLFLEVNPRFQGSTHASAQLSVEQEQPCLVLEHLGALLGCSAPARPPLRALMREVPELAHMVVQNTSSLSRVIDPEPLVKGVSELPGHCRTDVVTRADLLTEPSTVVARVTTRSRVTTTGFDLHRPWRDALDEAVAALRVPAPATDRPERA